MGKKSWVLMGAALALVLCASAYARAELYQVQFDARTQKIMQQDGTYWTGIGFIVEVWDTELKNPPDFVESITVVAPDNSTFQITTDQHWYPHAGEHYYDASFRPYQFKSGKIVGGTYKCAVKDVVGKSITVTDTVPSTFLTPPVINSPTEGSTIFEPLTVKWDRVNGAARYRINIWNNSRSEPVFWWWQDPLYVNDTEVTLPIGALRPNCNYRISVEARSEFYDTDQRARSKWIQFNTGSW